MENNNRPDEKKDAFEDTNEMRIHEEIYEHHHYYYMPPQTQLNYNMMYRDYQMIDYSETKSNITDDLRSSYEIPQHPHDLKIHPMYIHDSRFYTPLVDEGMYSNRPISNDESEMIDVDLTKRGLSIFPTQSESLETQLDGALFTIETYPLDHQVKECLIVPYPVIKIQCTPNNSDYIAVFLECDKRMGVEPIFLAAHSAKFCKNNKIVFDNLKVTNKMLKGRTKGYTFVLRFEYVSNSKRIFHLNSNQMNLWTHIGQKGFPREIRDRFRNRWKDSKYQDE